MTVASAVPSGKGKVLHPARCGDRLLEAIAGMLAPYWTGVEADRTSAANANLFFNSIRCKGGHNDRSQDW